MEIDESLMNEAAITDLNNIALFHDTTHRMIGIYNPDIVNIPENDFYDEIEDYIYGVITYKLGEYDIYEVLRVCAKNNYGVILYKILMDYAEDSGVFSERATGSVSDEAKSVWKKFYEGKSPDVSWEVPTFEEYNEDSDEYVDTEVLEDEDKYPEEYLNVVYYLTNSLDLSKSEDLNYEVGDKFTLGNFHGTMLEEFESYVSNCLRSY